MGVPPKAVLLQAMNTYSCDTSRLEIQRISNRHENDICADIVDHIWSFTDSDSIYYT